MFRSTSRGPQKHRNERKEDGLYRIDHPGLAPWANDMPPYRAKPRAPASQLGNAVEESAGEVALARIGEDDDDGLALEFRFLGEATGDSGRSAAGDA